MHHTITTSSSPDTSISMVSAVSDLNTHTSFTTSSKESKSPKPYQHNSFNNSYNYNHHNNNNNYNNYNNHNNHTGPTHQTTSIEMTPPRTPTHSIHSEEVKVSPHNDEEDYRSIAKKLFNETFVSIQPEEYTQFLSGTENDSEKIRDYYMNLFDWNINILTSIRTLCSKLYLKGESQELDRILTSFTKSYLFQFPKNNFYSSNFEQIYIIIYSIILLNTSLHNNLDLKKISQTDFIKNTLTTFLQQDSSLKLSIKQRIVIEQELSKIYDDLLRNELYLKGASSATAATAATTNHHEKSSDTSNGNQLTRQLSNGSGSIWSTDTGHNNQSQTPNNNNNNNNNIFGTRRLSAAAKRLSSISSNNQANGGNNGSSVTVNTTAQSVAASTATASTVNNNAARAGFRTALMTDQAIKGLRNRQSMDHLRNMHSSQQHPLYRKSSRSSIISRDSTNSGYGNQSGDDTISMISVDSKLKQLMDSNKVDNDGYDFNDHFDDTMSIGEEIENFNIENYQDDYDLTLELQGSPYLKEGLLKLKILHNDQQDETNSTNSSGPSNASITSTTSSRSFFSFFGGSRSANKRETTSLNQSTTGTSSSLLNMTNKFTENFVVVSKGQLSLYSFDPKIIKKHQQMLKKLKQSQMYQKEEELDNAVGDGNWLKNAANVGNYNLCSTFAKFEKSTHTTHPNSGKTYVWSLNFPRISNKKSSKKFLFEAGTKEIALEYINTCNFWASKITAIPTLEESVTSIEYGWTNLDFLIQQRLNFKKLKNIMKYESLPRGVYLSNSSNNNYGLMKQFGKTLSYYNHLKKLYQEFLTLKARFLKNFPVKQYNGTNYSKIIHNYDLKIEDYKEELNKYKNYLILLGFGLQLRFDLEDDEKEQNADETKEGEQNAEVENKKEEEEDDELTTMVKFEIKKLFFNMKDIANIIPTFESSKTISGLALLDHEQFIKNFNPLVKSPKNFTLSNFKDTESPIQQLLSSSGNNTVNNQEELSNSYSTNTIKEEDEEEDEGEEEDVLGDGIEKTDTETKVETPNLSTDSFQIIKEPAMRVRIHGVSTGAVLV